MQYNLHKDTNMIQSENTYTSEWEAAKLIDRMILSPQSTKWYTLHAKA